MPTLYVVRHAHADWIPDEDRPLSIRGSKDAVRVADILCDYPIRAIYSSPFRRARQTISLLAERLGLSIQIESDLRERRLGDGTVEEFFEAVEATWQNPSFTYPGGESSSAAQKRGIAFVQRLLEKHPAEQIAISTHGNLMALILQAFDPSVDFMFWKSLTMPDVYKLDVERVGRNAMQRLWREADA